MTNDNPQPETVEVREPSIPLAQTVQTWNHSRKGRIRGVVLADRGGWLDILLAEDVVGVGLSWYKDDVICVRASYLTEVQG